MQSWTGAKGPFVQAENLAALKELSVKWTL